MGFPDQIRMWNVSLWYTRFGLRSATKVEACSIKDLHLLQVHDKSSHYAHSNVRMQDKSS